MSLQFFIADDGSDGSELWVTNGTSAGTFLLKDINAGLGGSQVGNLVQSNGIMYFTAYDGSATHLWRSDGTSAGTYALSDASNGDNASNPIDVNGTLYYLGSDSVHGAGLFKSDGTVGGTTFVQTVSSTSGFIAVGNTLFFQAYDPATGFELWKSDGTAAGTGIVKDIMPGGNSSSLGNFTVSGGKLFFTATDDTHGTELWVSNGTAAGTFLVKDLNPGLNNSANPGNLFSDGTHLFFTANDGAHGVQLYATDGTTAGTHVLSVAGYSNFTRFDNHVYFIANDSPSGRAIYTSDGTTVTKIQHLNNFSDVFYNLGDKLVFQGDDGTHGGGLYTFDGTTTTFAVATPPGFQQPVVSNGKLFFVAFDSAHGYELWVSDGTAAGTHITADVNPGAYDGNIGNISAVGNGVVFTATRPDIGTELFFSDGTAAGTILAKDVNPTGNHSPNLNMGSNIFSAGGKGFFSANDNINGYELWVTDGTTGGTHMVNDLVTGASSSSPQNFFVSNNKLFYTADDGVHGRQLYTSDGTEAGTIRLTSPSIGGTPFNDSNDFFTINGHLYYMGYDADNVGAYALFTSDGTVAGTTKVTHFASFNTAPIAFNGGVVFYANDGTNGYGIYTFNGSAATFVSGVSNYENPVVSGGNLFFRSNDGGNGYELWVSDGTTAGTHLTADINPGGYDSYPQNIASLGNGSVVYSAFNPTTGTELYISNGTAAGTKLLSDVNPTGDHAPWLNINSDIYAAGGKGFFVADDNIHGNELWVGDGTVAGSHMVTDMVVGASSSSPQNFYAFGGKMYFTSDDGVHGRQLYVSDGTAAGTIRLTSNSIGGTPFNDSNDFFTIGGHFYYMGYDADNVGAYALFTTDGTVAGTTKVAHFASFNTAPIALNSGVIFYANDGTNGYGLYTFNGTTATFVAAVSNYESPVASGGKLFFRSNDGGHGSELWVTDGTAAGTHITLDINPGGYDSSPQNITGLGNGSVVFTATNPGTGTEIYVSDGTAAGTTLLKDVNATGDHGAWLSINSDIYAAGGKGFFVADDNIHGNELWVGDGTAAGSHMVTDLVVGANASSPQNFYAFGGKMYFTSDDGTHGRQLYVSDGTATGTIRLTSNSIGGTPFNNSSDFFTIGGHFYYMGYDSDANGGYALFTTDGTVVGTTRVLHFSQFITDPVQLGSTVLFYANDGTNGNGIYSFNGTTATLISSINDYESPVASGGKMFFHSNSTGGGQELWVTDGTAAGTHLVTEINPGGDSNPSSITSLGNGSVAFVADDGTHGAEMWVSDGTAAGTVMLGDLFPDAQGSNPANLTLVGSKLYFVANYFSNVDGAHGRELFVTDGTPAGTHMVKDINAGSGDSNPSGLFVSNGKLYFSAYDTSFNGYSLWTTDGTDAGTHTIASSDGFDDNYPGNFIAADATHFYFTANAGLFYSDGTAAGTHFVSGLNGFDINRAEMINGQLLFRNYDGTNGYELWRSDGTAAGTYRVTDTLLPNSSGAGGFTFAGNGKIFFYANDGVHGYELWVTNGTSAGTSMVKDIDVGSDSANPNGFYASNGKIFFYANDGVHGTQLWSSDGTAAGTQMVPSSDGHDDGYPGNFITIDATHFYFTGNDGLFYSDGTSAGTHFVSGLNGFDINRAEVVNGVLLFRNYDGTNGYELWRSDGTAAGTYRVTDTLLPNSSSLANFTFVGTGKVFFTANDGTHGNELFVTDGTSAGTTLLKDINPTGDSNPSNLFVFNGQLFFSAFDPTNGSQLWSSDGTTAGTKAISSSDGHNDGSPGNFLPADGTHFFFTGNDGLFYSDGTSAGTHFVTGLNGFTSGVYQVVNGVLYFQEYDGTNGYEMWKSDGTAAGTVRVTDTQIPNSSNPGNFAAIDNVPPTVTGTATLSINDNVTTHPFAATVIGDADAPVQTMTVTITLDDPAKGAFTAASLSATGVVAGGVAGSYTFTGTPAQATAALQALVFQPTDNHLVVGNSETTTFTVSVNDGHGGSVVDHTTTVTATSVNDAPIPGADAVAVNEDATAAAASRATGLLGNDTDADVGETPTIKVVGAHFGAASDTTVAAAGQTSIVGTYGTLHLAADGSYSYTPNSAAAEALPQGQAASDVFSYTVADVHGATGVTTLTFNITGREDAPVAVADTVAVNEDVAVTVATRAGGVLGNDTDVDTGEQATLKVSGAHFGAVADTAVAASGTTDIVGTYGTLHIAANGTYTYTPNSGAAEALTQGQAASDIFHYTMTDAQGVSAASTLTFNVTGQNDAPVAVAETVSVNEDSLASVASRATGLLGNDSDVDTGETATLTVTAAHAGSNSNMTVAASGTTDIVGTYGTLHLTANGTYSYTPNSVAAEALALGTPASEVFTYTVTDVHGASATTTLTFNITGQEDAPVAVANTVAVNEDATASAVTRGAGLLGNDTDVDNGETATLKVSGAHFGATADTAVASSGTTDIVGTYGTLHLAADGTYTYTPNSAAAEALPQGQAASDVFSYTIVDVQGASSTSTLTFNVTGQNDGPVAVSETVALNEDASAAGATRGAGLLGNDSDVDTGETATLKVAGAHVGANSDTTVAASGTTDIVGTYATLHLAANGTYSYTANSGAAEALTQGQAASDVFSYTIADVHGATATSTLTFNLTGQNDAPVAVANTVAVNEDVAATAATRGAGLLGNDTDVDGGETATLKVSGAHFGAAADTAVASSGTTDIVGTYGTLHLTADGTYSYTPNSAAAQALTQGQAASDVFSYTIVDAQGATSASTLTFNVTGQNDGPVAVSETVAVNEDATAAAATRGAGLLGNDSDVDTGETATLKVSAAHFGAAADTTIAASGTTDIVGTYGTLHLAADGTYAYTPNNGTAEALTQGQTASDLFSYTIADVHGATTTSTLTFNITGQNDGPVAVTDTKAVNEDATASAVSPATGLLGNDSDVDTGETATLKVTGAHSGAAADTTVASSGTTDIVGTYGTLHLAADGTYTYTPNNGTAEALTQGQAASDVFSYTIADVHGASTTSTLTFNITGQNDGPVAVADTKAVNEDATATAATRVTGLLGNDSDVDSGETATLKITGAHVGGNADTSVAASGTTDIAGTYGTLHVAADGTYSYTPNSAVAEALTQGAAASDVFSYTIADVHGASTTSTLTFNITGQNDGPVAVADTKAVNEDATATAATRATGLLGNDSDVDSGETATLKVTGAHVGGNADTAVAASGTTDIVGTYGTLHVAADGTYSYTANSGAAEALTQGQAASDVFSYTVADVHGATTTSTLTFNLTGQNDGPAALADTRSVNEDATATAATRGVGLLGNDSDVDSGETATLKITGAHVGAASDTAVAASGTTDIVGTYGTLHLAADGTYSYTPNSAASEALTQGAAASDVFSYTIADVHGATTTSTLTFNVTGQNDGPVAVGETVALNEDVGATAATRGAGLLANDSDVDTGETATLKISGAHAGAASDTAVAASGTTDIVGTYGTLHLAADGTYAYTPDSAAAEALPQGQPASDVFSYTVTDAHGASTTSTLTFDIAGVDDPGVAVADVNGTLENAAITGASVFGNDHDVDNPLHIGSVNGSSAAVGTQIVLASGALLTLRADGTYDYDPNHVFDSLTGVSGATNHTATDSFSYTLSDGSSATVTITVTGVSTTGDQAQGTSGADTMTGTANVDYFNLSAGGDDTASGGGGNDAFYLGAAFNAADHIDGGAGTNDQIGIEGDYSGANRLVLGADTIAGVEVISVLAGHDYDITSNDGNVAAGQVLTIYGSTLGAGDSLTFDGSAETDGSFRVYGGLGTDNFTGGAGDDAFYFGRDGRFDPLTDHIDGGAGSNDQLALDGSYTVAISGANLTNIETLVLLDGTASMHAHYHITLDDDWTAAGQTHTIYGVQVRDGFTIDGSAESDGNFKVYGGLGSDTITTGAGNDWIHGGAGADMLDGGAGADTFVYSKASDSTGTSHDTIIGFDAAFDHIDLPGAVTGIDAAITTGTLDAGNFDNDLSTALAGLNAHHAISFTASSGDLAGHVFEVIDTNGVAGYQAGQDLVIEMQNPVHPIVDTTSFV